MSAQDIVEAVRWELEAQGRRASGTSTGRRMGRLRQSGADVYERGFTRLSRTDGGRRLGEWASGAASALSKLPVITVMADASAARHCIDLLTTRHDANPRDPEANLHLAVALENAEADRAALAYLRVLVNPTSVVLSSALRQTSRLGSDSRAGRPERLRRRAHVYAARAAVDGPTWSDLFTLARVRLLDDAPVPAIRFAFLAHEDATRRSKALPPRDTRGFWDRARDGYRAGGIDGLLGTAAVEFGREPSEHDLTTKQIGASYVVAAWAASARGEFEAAQNLCRHALDHDMTVAHQVRAAIVDPDLELPVRERLSQRHALLDQIRSGDRALYYGAARSLVPAAGVTARAQARRTGRLARSATRLLRDA